MAPPRHDLTYQIPPVAPVDVWDHNCVVVANRNPCGLVLPAKRQPQPRAPRAIHSSNKAQIGRLIDVGITSRQTPPIDAPAHIQEFGGAVVKLNPLCDAGPFHANNVIPALNPGGTEAPQRLYGEG